MPALVARAPAAWAASSSTQNGATVTAAGPVSSAIGAGFPKRWTGHDARGTSVNTGSTVAAVRQCVSASISANTGRAPALTTASAVAKKLTPGTMTSSPGWTPSARSAIVSASVPFATPMQ